MHHKYAVTTSKAAKSVQWIWILNTFFCSLQLEAACSLLCLHLLVSFCLFRLVWQTGNIFQGNRSCCVHGSSMSTRFWGNSTEFNSWDTIVYCSNKNPKQPCTEEQTSISISLTICKKKTTVRRLILELRGFKNLARIFKNECQCISCISSRRVKRLHDLQFTFFPIFTHSKKKKTMKITSNKSKVAQTPSV